MCGIIGYVGKRQAAPILLDGLRRLEYRGYDSAGVAVLREDTLALRKKQGKLEEGLGRALREAPIKGDLGIGHTRWATHGPPSDANAHPHLDRSGRIALVHNGIIENHEQIRIRLLEQGHQFASKTDSEVLAHLIGRKYEGLPGNLAESSRLAEAVKSALREVTGTYGLAVISRDHPGVIVAARRGSPLVIGMAESENFVASDVNALVAHTRRVVFLNDYDVATLYQDRFDVENLGSGKAEVCVSQIGFEPEAADRGKFPHYMLKEIFEQPRAIENACRGRVHLEEATAKFGGLNLTPSELRAIDRVVIIACGTSWHAGLVGEYLFESLAHLPTEVEYASEFRYRNAPIEKNTLVLAISQSGETADTLAALREAKRRGHMVLSICNVVGSTIAREADGGIFLHAGPEIGVASTKAFTSQITVLVLLAVLMGRLRTLSAGYGLQLLTALEKIPAQMERVLGRDEQMKKLAQKYCDVHDFYFLGRQISFPVALEGALKLKEISYIHAEGYPAAEMKHGPIALIDEQSPSVVLAPSDSMYEKVLGNLEVVKARKGPVIAIASEGDSQISSVATDVIYVPQTSDELFPLLAIVPLQLLAYHVAVLRGCDVDKPRNLAKSVTVE